MKRMAWVLMLFLGLILVLGVAGCAKEEWTTYEVTKTDGFAITWGAVGDTLAIKPPTRVINFPSTFVMKVSKQTFTDEKGGVYGRVVIPKKSFKGDEYVYTTTGWLHAYVSLLEDAEGKIYISGGDVDVKSVVFEPMDPPVQDPLKDRPLRQVVQYTFGDGVVDPEGSLMILLKMHTESYIAGEKGGPDGPLFEVMDLEAWWTTGSSTNTIDPSAKGPLGNCTVPRLGWDRTALVDNVWTKTPVIEPRPMDANMNGVWMTTLAALNQWFALGPGDLDTQLEAYVVLSGQPK